MSSHKLREATPRTCHDCLPGEPYDNGVLVREPWSKNIRPREDLRQYLGKQVEVLATYGRKRIFTVGVSLMTGEILELSEEHPEGIPAESEYASIKKAT